MTDETAHAACGAGRTGQAEMTHTFKVGETYKTRDGGEVKVVHEFPDGGLVIIDGRTAFHARPDGRMINAPHGCDLMPPEPEMVQPQGWAIIRRNGRLFATYDTFASAKVSAAYYADVIAIIDLSTLPPVAVGTGMEDAE